MIRLVAGVGAHVVVAVGWHDATMACEFWLSVVFVFRAACGEASGRNNEFSKEGRVLWRWSVTSLHIRGNVAHLCNGETLLVCVLVVASEGFTREGIDEG